MSKQYSLLFLLMSLVVVARPQDCINGSGGNIFKMDFGNGTGQASPVVWATGLQYSPDACPEPEGYSIVMRNPGCAPSTALSSLTDHTGGADGRFMLLDVDDVPTIAFEWQVTGLCPNMSYEMDVWMADMNEGGQENGYLIMRSTNIDGTELASHPELVRGGPSTGSFWQRHALNFTTGPKDNTIVLYILAGAVAGKKWLLGIDDISLRPVGPKISIGAIGYPGDTVSICLFDQQKLTLDATVESCYPSADIQWQTNTEEDPEWKSVAFGRTLQYQRPPTLPGKYNYRIMASPAGAIGNPACQIFSTPLHLAILERSDPGVYITASNNPICLNRPVSFQAFPTNGGDHPKYEWKINASTAGGDSSVFATSNLVNGDAVTCRMTSSEKCTLSPVVESNIISYPVIPPPKVKVTITAAETAICKNMPASFSVLTVNAGVSPRYMWTVNGKESGQRHPDFRDSTLSDGDTINCLVIPDMACGEPTSSSEPVVMKVHPDPLIQLDSVSAIATGSEIRLSPLVSVPVASWEWSPSTYLSDPTRPDPVARPPQSITYRLHVVSTDGCSAFATQKIGVYLPMQLPNAFTPNGDGRNDIFRIPPALQYPLLRFSIFDRFGEMVFSTVNKEEGWNGEYAGKKMPGGTYIWQALIKNPLNGKNECCSGTFLLIR